MGDDSNDLTARVAVLEEKVQALEEAEGDKSNLPTTSTVIGDAAADPYAHLGSNAPTSDAPAAEAEAPQQEPEA